MDIESIVLVADHIRVPEILPYVTKAMPLPFARDFIPPLERHPCIGILRLLIKKFQFFMRYDSHGAYKYIITILKFKINSGKYFDF